MRVPKQSLLVGLMIFASLVLPNSFAEVIHCTGVHVQAGSKYGVKLDISLFELEHLPPAYAALHEGIAGRYRFKEWIGAQTPIKVGELRIRETLGSSLLKEPRNYKFLVTALPDSADSLIGFVLDGTYVHVLRVELRKKKKPFTFYDSEKNSIAQGGCK